MKKMKKWTVTGVVTGSKHLGEFEAYTQEEAEEKAINSEEANVFVCHQCASEIEDPEIHEVILSLVKAE